MSHQHIDLDLLSQYFHKPITEVSKELGICATVLKKICRKNGIPRWPHRKIKSLDNMIMSLKRSMAQHQDDSGKIQKEVARLKKKRSDIMRNPSLMMQSYRSSSNRSKQDVFDDDYSSGDSAMDSDSEFNTSNYEYSSEFTANGSSEMNALQDQLSNNTDYPNHSYDNHDNFNNQNNNFTWTTYTFTAPPSFASPTPEKETPSQPTLNTSNTQHPVQQPELQLHSAPYIHLYIYDQPLVECIGLDTKNIQRMIDPRLGFSFTPRRVACRSVHDQF